MAAYHDFQCDSCGEIFLDMPVRVDQSKCPCGPGRLEIFWNAPTSRNATPISTGDACVVYQHPLTGKVIWPGRNDEPMPARYQARGFERREMRSLGEIDKFSQSQGVVNERAHYNSGNGYDEGRR